MIWLSPAAGKQECSLYFDLRDIELRRTGQGLEGAARGLIGDGQCELWAEIEFGQTAKVQILPLWSEDGVVEGFDDSVDETLLAEQLLASLKELLAGLGQFSAPERLQHAPVTYRSGAQSQPRRLAA